MIPRTRIAELFPRGPWLVWIVLACLLRLAIPLAALAASGHALPGQPAYYFEATPGDAQGFYSAARDFMAAWGRLGPLVIVLVALGVAAALAFAWSLWRRGRTELAVLVVAGAFSLAVTIAVTETSRETGAAVFGWPLIWSLPMLPYRALGLPLNPTIAFGFGLALSMLAIVTTTVATWLIGLRATGNRAAAALAVGLFAAWPFLGRVVVGPGAWENGSWNVDVGLHLYDEPASAALVAVAVVLLLAPRLAPVPLAVAGVLLSLSVAVRLSNALIAALALLVVALRVGPRRALPLAAGLVTFAPVVGAWWPRGYAALFDRPDVWPEHPFSFSHVLPSWTDSLLFTPRALAVLVPLALVGALMLRRSWSLALLGGLIAVTAVFYSFYANTPMHPRFLYVIFPALFTLWAAGAVTIAVELARRVPQSARAVRGQT